VTPEPANPVTLGESDRAALENAIQEMLDAHRNNNKKWEPVYGWFRDRFGVEGGRGGSVAGKLLTEAKQVPNRIRKELPEMTPEYIILTLLPEVSLDDAIEKLRQAYLPKAKLALIFENTTIKKVLVFDG
jgi:hypothetical protein